MKTKLAILSLIILVISALPASADMYEMDRDTAALLTVQSHSDAEGTHTTYYVGYNPGAPGDLILGSGHYAAEMNYAVGFYGNLQTDYQEDIASVYWGLGPNHGLTGEYEGFILPISNDNQQVWEFMAYVVTDAGTFRSNPVVSLTGQQTTTTLALNQAFDFADVLDIGFIVQFNKATTGEGTNSSDDYHVSVVPVPAAMLLGLLGLGTAGMRLRRKSA